MRSFWAMCAVVLAAAGCGVRPTGVIDAGPPPKVGGAAATITVYLLRGDRLYPALRPGLPGHPYLSLQQLSVRPTEAERRLGLRTEVDVPLAVRMVNGSSRMVVDAPGRRRNWPRPALAQIACTADALPGVERVVLRDLVRGDLAARPLTCADFDDLRP